jgi:membrane protease YdiL (CAAX protease family)
LTDSPPDNPTPPEVAGPALGLFRLTIEGRRAPGLFVAGWLGLLLGTIVAVVGLLAGQTLGGAILFVAGLAAMFIGLVLLGGSQVVERRGAGLAYAGPSPILVFAAIVAGLYLTVVIVATPLRLVGIRLDGPGLALFGAVLQAAVVVGVLRLFVVGNGALSWPEMGLRFSLPAVVRDLAWGAVFAPPIILITAVAVSLLVTIVGSTPTSPLPPSGTSIGLAINLVAGALIAPVYEELFFRGFATSAWARMVGPTTAIVRTSVLFALAHVITQGGDSFTTAFGAAVVAAAVRLPVAFALGWVYIRRGSLWASIGLRAMFNAILIILAEWGARNLPVG